MTVRKQSPGAQESSGSELSAPRRTIRMDDEYLVRKDDETRIWKRHEGVARELSRGTGRPLFVLFTSSDASPLCVAMDNEILHTQMFNLYARDNLVLLRLEYPRNTGQQSQWLRDQNSELLKRFGIVGFPTVVILAPGGGEEIARTGYFEGVDPSAYIQHLGDLISPADSTEKRRTQAASSAEQTVQRAKDVMDERSPRTGIWLVSILGALIVLVWLVTPHKKRKGRYAPPSRAQKHAADEPIRLVLPEDEVAQEANNEDKASDDFLVAESGAGIEEEDVLIPVVQNEADSIDPIIEEKACPVREEEPIPETEEKPVPIAEAVIPAVPVEDIPVEETFVEETPEVDTPSRSIPEAELPLEDARVEEPSEEIVPEIELPEDTVPADSSDTLPLSEEKARPEVSSGTGRSEEVSPTDDKAPVSEALSPENVSTASAAPEAEEVAAPLISANKPSVKRGGPRKAKPKTAKSKASAVADKKDDGKKPESGVRPPRASAVDGQSGQAKGKQTRGGQGKKPAGGASNPKTRKKKSGSGG